LPGGEGEENKAEGDTSNLGPAIIIRRKLEWFNMGIFIPPPWKEIQV
jgi:hypothetical protein